MLYLCTFSCNWSVELNESKISILKKFLYHWLFFITEDERPFTYTPGAKKGPGNWADLNPKWKACANGRLQSPIDLADERVEVMPKLGTLKRKYKPAPALIKNRGHDIEVYRSHLILKLSDIFHVINYFVRSKQLTDFYQVVWQGDAGGAILNGTKYNLLQCHWHTPSEHTLNGKRFGSILLVSRPLPNTT